MSPDVWTATFEYGFVIVHVTSNSLSRSFIHLWMRQSQVS